MDEMKFDMSGAATVIAALTVASELALPLNVVGLVPTCETYAGWARHQARRHRDERFGADRQILNTDAEGRLILPDRLCTMRAARPPR